MEGKAVTLINSYKRVSFYGCRSRETGELPRGVVLKKLKEV